jgi:hypothetical protein
LSDRSGAAAEIPKGRITMPMTQKDWDELNADFEEQLDRYMAEWVKTLREAGPNTADDDKEEEDEEDENRKRR